jgi:hypothetical protein
MVWGGWRGEWPGRSRLFGDGALFDETAATWERVPAAPLEPRRWSAVAWTGSELFVWGGSTATAHRADGALWNPLTGWRVVAPAPLAPRSSPQTVRVGREIFVLGGWDNVGPLPDGASYDLDSGVWRAVPDLPRTFVGDGFGTVDAPGGPVLWSFNHLPGAGVAVVRYDRERNSWRSLPHLVQGAAAMTFNDGRLYAMTGGGPNGLFVLDERAGEWEAVNSVRGSDAGSATNLVAAGRYLYVLQPDPTLTVRRFDIRRRIWGTLPTHPLAWEDYTAMWTGRDLLIWGLGSLNPERPSRVHVIRWRPS